VIVRHILDLDRRRFAPTYTAVCNIANKLLAVRSVDKVRQKWLANFVKCTDSLTARFN
jgi:hypothetical protein